MMPMAPTSIMAIPTSKPKIGFSIDSIVGSNNTTTSPHHHNNNSFKLKGDLGQLTTKTPLYFSPNSEGSELPASPLSDDCYAASDVSSYGGRHGNYISSKASPTTDINRALRLSNCSPEEFHHRLARFSQKGNNPSPPPPSSQQQHGPPSHFRDLHSPDSRHLPSMNNNNNNSSAPQMHPDLRTPPVNSRLSPDNNSPNARSPTPPPQQTQLPTAAKGPIVVPGIPAGLVRPFPVGPGGMPQIPDVKPLPPYMNTGEMVQPHNPHFLAAQFQMAAAIAHQQSGGFPPQHPGAHMQNPNMPRESYPLYPWLLSRHGRIFPHRFPGNFLLQPFRKPKRVRTAFSPSQLLKLEHAFENNHYVVGAERKTLAQTLSLTETQVKVWFQNRRTKHKRMQQEDDAKNGGSSMRSPGSYDDEDELIDMEMDDECPSDEEE